MQDFVQQASSPMNADGEDEALATLRQRIEAEHTRELIKRFDVGFDKGYAKGCEASKAKYAKKLDKSLAEEFDKGFDKGYAKGYDKGRADECADWFDRGGLPD